MNEVVIFCESYPQIKNALYLSKQNYQDHPVTIMVTMPDLYKFFNLVNEKVFQGGLNVVYFDIYRGRTAKAGSKIIKALYLLPDIVKERQYLKKIFKKHFAQLRKAEVFFSSRFFNPSTFYLLRKLSTTNSLVYIPDPSYDAILINKAAPANITEVVSLLKSKIVYGWDIALGKHPLGQKITRMPDEFIRKRVARVISREERERLLRNFDTNQFRLFNNIDCSIMYFHEDLVEHDYVTDHETFERRLAEVFNIIGKHFPENKVALKYHPGYAEGEPAVPFGSRLPDFIPAEFLYSGKIRMYLGISTMALANVEKGLAVSLIYLIGFKNDTIREQLKKALIQWSHSEILFPQSLDEFERILIDIKNKKFEEVQ